MITELTFKEIRKSYDDLKIDMNEFRNLTHIDGIVGQDRAVKALKFGLHIEEKGFNIYVAGPAGIGKMTAIKTFIQEFAQQKDTPSDWVYVNNFDEPYCPNAIKIPPGRGREFQNDIKNFTNHFWEQVPKIFDSDDYNSKKDLVLRDLNINREKMFIELNDYAGKKGFTLQSSKLGILIVPVLGGRPLNDNEFQSLPQAAKDDIIIKKEILQEEIKKVMKKVNDFEKEAQKKLDELDKRVITFVISGIIDDLKKKYQDVDEIADFLNDVQNDILNNINLLKFTQSAQSAEGNPVQSSFSTLDFIKRYQVNLIVDNSKIEGAPVIVETNSTYNHLFGKIEKEPQMGTLVTDFTMIKAGSLHYANGGYLVIPIEELLKNIYSWDALKRALDTKKIQIEELSERLGYVSTKSLKPEPIPLNLKVILVGAPFYYYLLYSLDEEFSELFKVKADFDTDMDSTDENIKNFLYFLNTFLKKENIIGFSEGSIKKLLEFSSRIAEDQHKLTTKFGTLSNIIKEANYWAAQENSRRIESEHVKKAIDESIYRSNMIDEKIDEMIKRGDLLIDTSGVKVGQINGLSVLSYGDYSFGKPGRITATVGVGKEGVIDIEREAELGGPIHSKGVMILNGFLSQKFAQDKPMSLTARLVFEQSYSGVEGDSASSAELYVILSSLAGLPIKQDIAVTGSVNQKGEIQPIGGVNEKIEGYFDICKYRGLTGEQGVIIPRTNVKNLMLKEEILDYVKNNKFHIWSIDTIEDGIEILTGIKAGEFKDGSYDDNSVYNIVDKKLKEFSKCQKKSE